MDRRKKTVIYLLTILIIIIGLGTLGMYYLEGWRIEDAAYWAVFTTLTIGDPTHVPTTLTGKAFVILYAIVSVSVGLYALLHIAAYVIEQNQRNFELLEDSVPRKVNRIVRKIRNRNKL